MHRSVVYFKRSVKISSHQGEHRFTQHVERWAFRGNEQADAAAEMARQFFPDSLMQIWEQLASFLDTQSTMRDHLRSHFLRVAELAVSHKEDIRKYDTLIWDSQLAQSSPEVAIAEISFSNWAEVNSNIEDVEVHALLQFWLHELLLAPCADREPIWLSSYQLLLDFQNVYGMCRLSPWTAGKLTGMMLHHGYSKTSMNF